MRQTICPPRSVIKNQDGCQVYDVFLKRKPTWLRALSDGRSARVQHGKDSAHPQQESWSGEPASAAGDRWIHSWVRTGQRHNITVLDV